LAPITCASFSRTAACKSSPPPIRPEACIGASTRIFDRASGQILYGRVPAGSVVVPGTLPSADGKYGLYCAVIVKKVDAQTRAKTAINELLRGE
jgi:2,3,4,5-tetrahydropyridine-2-carboxylate N-succinyltransferase